MRIVTLVIGTTIAQIFIYTILVGTGLFIENYVDLPKHSLVDWAFQLLYSVLLFSVIVFLLNLLTVVINRKWFIYTSITLAITFYFIGWGEDFDTHPYRTSFLMLSGIASILYKLPIDEYFRKKTKRIAC